MNGRARVTLDGDLIARFEKSGKCPRSVIVFKIEEIYFQCARALMRSALWTDGDQSADLPTPGMILAAMTQDEVGGPDYDAKWPTRAALTLW